MSRCRPPLGALVSLRFSRANRVPAGGVGTRGGCAATDRGWLVSGPADARRLDCSTRSWPSTIHAGRPLRGGRSGRSGPGSRASSALGRCRPRSGETRSGWTPTARFNRRSEAGVAREDAAHSAVADGPRAGLQPLKWEPGTDRPACAGLSARASSAGALDEGGVGVGAEKRDRIRSSSRRPSRRSVTSRRSRERPARKQIARRRPGGQFQAPTSAVAGPLAGRPQPRSERRLRGSIRASFTDDVGGRAPPLRSGRGRRPMACERRRAPEPSGSRALSSSSRRAVVRCPLLRARAAMIVSANPRAKVIDERWRSRSTRTTRASGTS